MNSPERPAADQPLRAHWDPTSVDNGRPRSDRSAPRKKSSSLGRFIATYGWRAYAIPVLIVITVVLVVATLTTSDKSTGGSGVSPVGDETRNTDVEKAKTPIGAPTGTASDDLLQSGALPAGGPFTKTGKREWQVIPGTAPQVGTGGQVYTYTVEYEKGVAPEEFGGPQAFAKMVDSTLANPKSWIGDGKVSFRRIDRGTPDLRVSLASVDTTRELCNYQIKLESSCFYPPEGRVTLNESRWVRGALSFQGDDLSYRQYLLNHEVGHGIGYPHHQPCKGNGQVAPVMMQQTFGLSNKVVMATDPEIKADPNFTCKPNAWPYPDK